jgi:hypothetical protein
MSDWQIQDAEGNTIKKGDKFHISGMEQFTGVIQDIIDPDSGIGLRLKVKYDQPPEDVEELSCWRMGQFPEDEDFECNEIVVWQE